MSSTLYLPFVANESRPSRGFGIGIRSQCGLAHRDRALELLAPPCWHNWASFWPASGIYPQIWNPEQIPHTAWNHALAQDQPELLWLIGNEPLSAFERTAYWSPEQMATQANVFHSTTGAAYALCGEVPDVDGLAYTQKCLNLGCNPAALHFHIYEYYVSDWLKALDRIRRFETRRHIIISETNARGRDVDGQRELMDVIMTALATDPQLHAVFWYVAWAPDCPPNEQLLDSDQPDCRLTATGRHYVAVTQ